MISDERVNTSSRQGGHDPQEVHLLDLLIVLARHKRLVLGLPLVSALLALSISLIITPIYTSTVKLMPPGQGQGGGLASAMLGQLGGLAGMAGGLAGLKSPTDLYVGILESRTVADSLIDRFNLMKRYGFETLDETRIALDEVTDINTGKKDGMISVSVDDEDPAFAAELANAYADELSKLTQTMAVSDASKQRLFYEKQLKDAKDQLAEAEIALRQTQEKTGIVQPEAQVQAIVGGIAQIRASIAAKEVQLKAMRTFATARNPDLLRLQEELSALRAQLAQMEKSSATKDGEFMISASRVPEAGVEYIRRLRDLKYAEAMFELLAKQFELSKIEEAKDSSVVQILDQAVPAQKKTKPKRAVITLLGLVAGGMLGILLAFAREAYIRSRNNPDDNSRWSDLSRALSKSVN